LYWDSTNGYDFTAGRGIAYNSNTNLWVATGTTEEGSNYTIQWSSDGNNWNPAASGGFSGNAAYGIATSGPLWVATGVDQTNPLYTIQWSSDGSNWYRVQSGGFDWISGGPKDDAYNVAYSPQQNLWVAVGNSSNDSRSTIQWSSDGSNWYPAQSGGFDIGESFGGGIAYHATQQQWVATGYTAAGGATSILHSRDGSNWSPAASGGFQSVGAAGYGVAANCNAGTFITPNEILASNVLTQTLTASTINGVPNGQGYTDTTTFQFNSFDPALGFQTGLPLSTGTTLGYIAHRPYAPLQYFNVVYSSFSVFDTYSLEFSTVSGAPALYGPYYFSSIGTGVPEVYEQFVPPLRTTATQPLALNFVPRTGVLLYSATLGYN
jgi:hypothetical protein